MKALPVPPLSETLRRMLRAVGAVADERTTETTCERIVDFEKGAGPRVQAALEEFALAEELAGRSWLSKEWLDGYLTVRAPLALSTNVSFQITGDFGAPGTGRAADFLHCAAAVHLAQARGETPQEVDGRGNEMDMDQWLCLNGGIRHPQAVRDGIRRSERGGESREIGVLAGGRLFAVPVSDDAGRPLPAEHFRRAVEQMREAVAGPGAGAEAPGFADASAIGGAALAGPLAELTAERGNAETYGRLTDFLFTLTLVEEARPDVEHLRELTFGRGHVWAYKPISYEIGLADDWLCLHAEHSTVDGATLLSVVGRIQEAREASRTGGSQDATVPADTGIEELAWTWPVEARTAVEEALAQYDERAEPYRVALVTVPGLPADLPFKVSADAAQQLIMATAQVLAHGRVRAAYEAVDMREHTAGRTECLRPATPEAVAFATALADGAVPGERLRELLVEALDAHRGWVKACKAGHGFDRHLLGLQRAAERLGVEDPLFADPGMRAARTDFLSTTSIGGADRIVRYAFAPAVPEGFGITYTPRRDVFEFCVSWQDGEAERPEEFLVALERAAALLRAALGE